jgi:acylglycerol lipase
MRKVESQSMELSRDALAQVQSWLEVSSGSRRAFYRWASASQPAVASLLIIPGLGEHGGRYAESASCFAFANMDVFVIDMLGHGHSPGNRGCIDSYEALLDDVEAAIKEVTRLAPSTPIALWGHSMGGNVVINYLLRRTVLPRCAIASAPMLRSVREPRPPLLWIARQLEKLLPNFQLSSAVRPQHCTRDPRQQQLMRGDKLYFNSLSLRLGAALIDSGVWAIEHASRLSTPLLLPHGLSDTVTCPEASRQFAARAGKACELMLLEDRLHDLQRDLGSDEMLETYIHWIQGKLA